MQCTAVCLISGFNLCAFEYAGLEFRCATLCLHVHVRNAPSHAHALVFVHLRGSEPTGA